LRVDHLRLGEGANVDAPIEARLADLHRYAYIGGNRGNWNYDGHYSQDS